MVVVLLIGSALAGLVGAAIAWMLGGGLLTAIVAYAVCGNLVFSLSGSLLIRQHPREESLDFTSEIEADLQALLEERYERMQKDEDGPMRWCPVLRRPSAAAGQMPAKERRLFRDA